MPLFKLYLSQIAVWASFLLHLEQFEHIGISSHPPSSRHLAPNPFCCPPSSDGLASDKSLSILPRLFVCMWLHQVYDMTSLDNHAWWQDCTQGWQRCWTGHRALCLLPCRRWQLKNKGLKHIAVKWYKIPEIHFSCYHIYFVTIQTYCKIHVLSNRSVEILLLHILLWQCINFIYAMFVWISYCTMRIHVYDFLSWT